MYRQIAKTYYPLLVSKLFIVSEIFICAVAVARFENSIINQAALSGLILPLGFLYESMIYDLVTSSTALCKNMESYKVLRKYFVLLCVVLTVIGLLLFVSPLVDLLIFKVFNSTHEVAESAKPALKFLIIWPWVVGYRRMQQGVMIRSGRSDLVGIFSIVRVLFLCAALYLMYLIKAFPGAYSSTVALTISVCIEALLVHFAFEKLSREGKIVEIESEQLTLRQVNKFYLPLILSSLIHHFSLALASWAMFNMTDSLLSLSVWGAISGIVWLLATFGHSYVDVVVYFTQKQVSHNILKEFSYAIALITTFIVLFLLYLPTINNLVFVNVLNLSNAQLQVAKKAMLLSVFMPAIRCLVSVPQGILISNQDTKIVTQGVILNIFILGFFLVTATLTKIPILGIYCYLVSVTFALAMQYEFFCKRSRFPDSALE